MKISTTVQFLVVLLPLFLQFSCSCFSSLSSVSIFGNTHFDFLLVFWIFHACFCWVIVRYVCLWYQNLIFLVSWWSKFNLFDFLVVKMWSFWPFVDQNLIFLLFLISGECLRIYIRGYWNCFVNLQHKMTCFFFFE